MLELLNIVSIIRLFKIIIGTKPWLVELKILYPVHKRLLKCVNYKLCIITSNSVDLDVSLWLLQWGLVSKDCSLLRLPQSVDLDFPFVYKAKEGRYVRIA
jgi:hypothetical protein